MKKYITYKSECDRFLGHLPTELKEEIDYFAKNQTKKRSFIDRKAILVKYLRNNFNLTYQMIGTLFKNHYSSIVDLYFR